ncbi:MAG: GGDEF domain-containing protein [Myxococcaceae bacterium]|nr:GGDEF domain-containing protein [Myxococcaceae bacterium]
MKADFPSDSPLNLFTEDEVRAIFAAGRERTCSAGEAIIIEGELGDSMYFLIEGAAEARFDGGSKVRAYAPGSYFGELSFINPGQRRSTTIIATASSRVQVLDPGSVRTLLASHPHVIFTLLQRACAFLVDNERALIADLKRRNAELQQTIQKLEFTRNRLTEEEETARTDALSGLYNRRGLDAELPNFMARAKAIGSGLALIALDLDHFKPLNDTLGHAAGDFVLQGVGRILRERVRKSDLPCRVGGDEFLVLLADVNQTTASLRAESLRAAIAQLPHPGNEQGIRITSTIGGTLYRPSDTREDLMKRADEALYAAKRAGRNRVEWA